MWIRSQDRKSLLEIDDVEIDSVNQIWGSGSLLGKYSTYEKVIRVFDEIQDELDSDVFYETDLPDIFEMPLDEDVEV